jgi:hypothetical protein
MLTTPGLAGLSEPRMPAQAVTALSSGPSAARWSRVSGQSTRPRACAATASDQVEGTRKGADHPRAPILRRTHSDGLLVPNAP